VEFHSFSNQNTLPKLKRKSDDVTVGVV